MQRRLISVGRIAVILRPEICLGQQHAQFGTFATRRDHPAQLGDHLGGHAIALEVPRHRQPHAQRRGLQGRPRITLEQGARILLRRGVSFVGQGRLRPHEQQVFNNLILRRRADELAQVAAQLLALRRGLRPAHQQLQRDALGLGPLRIAQQLAESLAARDTALARDQAEH